MKNPLTRSYFQKTPSSLNFLVTLETVDHKKRPKLIFQPQPFMGRIFIQELHS